MGVWWNAATRARPPSLLCVPGHGRFVAAPPYDRIGEKGIKRNGLLTRIMDRIKERDAKEGLVLDARQERVENPRRG